MYLLYYWYIWYHFAWSIWPSNLHIPLKPSPPCYWIDFRDTVITNDPGRLKIVRGDVNFLMLKFTSATPGTETRGNTWKQFRSRVGHCCETRRTFRSSRFDNALHGETLCVCLIVQRAGWVTWLRCAELLGNRSWHGKMFRTSRVALSEVYNVIIEFFLDRFLLRRGLYLVSFNRNSWNLIRPLWGDAGVEWNRTKVCG